MSAQDSCMDCSKISDGRYCGEPECPRMAADVRYWRGELGRGPFVSEDSYRQDMIDAGRAFKRDILSAIDDALNDFEITL